MAKIIQFSGKYVGFDKYEALYINANCITSIRKATDKNQPVTCINIVPNNSIYTKLSIADVIKLVNG